MDFNDYQQKSLATAIYPNRGNNLAYTAFGIIEETGEVLEKLDILDQDGLKKEMGDQCWYIANCCSELNVKMQDLVPRMNSVICPDKDRDLVDFMIVQITKIAGKTKKMIRDDNGKITEDKKEAILTALAHIMAAIDKMAHNHNLDIEEIMEANLAKLLDRKNRNVLKGSGDNR